MKKILSAIVLCCLLPIMVSSQTAKAGRFESAIRAFEAADKEHFPAQGGVLFIGSSSIRRWTTLKQDMAPLPVIHRGFGGSQYSDVLEYFDRLVLPYHPADIVIYEGGNDINSGKSPEQVFADFRTFVARVHKVFPKTRIHVISSKPSIKRRASMDKLIRSNALIEGFCASDNRLYFLNVWNPMLDANGEPRPELFVEDDLHMNEAGYASWIRIIKPHLASVR